MKGLQLLSIWNVCTFHEYFAHFTDKGVVAQGKFVIIISYFFAAVVTIVYSKFVQFHKKKLQQIPPHFFFFFARIKYVREINAFDLKLQTWAP